MAINLAISAPVGSLARAIAYVVLWLLYWRNVVAKSQLKALVKTQNKNQLQNSEKGGVVISETKK